MQQTEAVFMKIPDPDLDCLLCEMFLLIGDFHAIRHGIIESCNFLILMRLISIERAEVGHG